MAASGPSASGDSLTNLTTIPPAVGDPSAGGGQRSIRQWQLTNEPIGAPFFEWVNQRVNERNAQLVLEKNLAIDMDPEVAKAFHASTAVSVQHGAGANMLKIGSKRRRPPAEVKAEREAKATKEAEMM